MKLNDWFAVLFVLNRLGSDRRATSGNVYYKSKGKLGEAGI